eukprot:TRINITY_DN10661_c0_g1_i1.p1 TRINITY_DN10661_c0_g1~~TRINITY_DN10661_c0_g1_i1.p1  ORF type:complete len:668 (-),score=203.69 TRINITY_DN10661_c0_g1_i1:134-2137(-)
MPDAMLAPWTVFVESPFGTDTADTPAPTREVVACEVELVDPPKPPEPQYDQATHVLVDRDRVFTKLIGGVPLLPAQLPEMDGSWKWIRKDNGPVHRATRLDAGELLRNAFEKGGYCFRTGGQARKVTLKKVKEMVKNTKVLRVSEGLPALPPGENLELHLDIASHAVDQAVHLTLAGYKVATVNAASAYHAGGGFTSGGRHALEEAFCSQTTLYPSLEKASKEVGHPHIPVDGCIMSPHVEIFRRGSAQGYLIMSEPVEIAAVISVAMYNCNPKVRDAPVDKPDSAAEYEIGLRHKMRAMAHAAALSGADALVLPDVGCGVFMNNPSFLGKIAGEILREYSSYFKLICFTGNEKFSQAATAELHQEKAKTVRLRLKRSDKKDLEKVTKSKDDVPPYGSCAVCKNKLDKSLCILVGRYGERLETRFIHRACAELVSEKYPGCTVMALPDIATDTQSFFQALDVDGDGSVSKDEVKGVMAAFSDTSTKAGAAKFEADFEAAWKTWDTNNSGGLSVNEFKVMELEEQSQEWQGKGLRRQCHVRRIDVDEMPSSLIAWMKLRLAGWEGERQEAEAAMPSAEVRDEVMRAFEKFDKNQNGMIDKTELAAVLKGLDPVSFDDEACLHMFQQADLDRDGQINADEFLAWAWNTNQASSILDLAKQQDGAKASEA